MRSRLLSTAAGLSDEDLLQRVRLLAGRERDATVELVAHLAELDTRKLHLAQGYSSLFGYCTEALHLAEHAAYNRIEAARASRRFPLLLDELADGSLNLSTVRLLVPHLTPENLLSVLADARRKSKREVEALVAHLCPRPDVPTSVRKLPPPMRPSFAPAAPAASLANAPPATPDTLAIPVILATPAAVDTPALLRVSAEPGGEAQGLPDAAPSPRVPASGTPVPPAAIPRIRPAIAPLAAQRYRVQFTVGQETHENLRRAQDLLRREIPDGDPGAIFDRALKLLLQAVAKKKLAATTRPRPRPVTAARSRHIPAHVKRAVWRRDGGRCAFVGKTGRRCGERAFLEFHHVDPYALGGETTAANLVLHCRAHNVHEAEPVFGVFVSVGRETTGARGRSVARPGG